MKTLVIHPDDISTAFLSQVYEGKDWTIINDNPSKRYLKEQIEAHDRIIMMGHGTKWGLHGFQRTIVDSSYVYLLREKEIIAIWCNADEFVKKYDLKGFYTGMIISEFEEAINEGVFDATYKDVNLSNILFTDAVTKTIDSDDMLGDMIKEYVGDSPVINFNKERLYKR